MGSSSTPIVFAEIIPIVIVANETERYYTDQATRPSNPQDHRQQLSPLTTFGVKQYLLREAREADAMAMSTYTSGSANIHQFFIRWNEEDDSDNITSISNGYVFQNEKDRQSDLGSIEHGKFPLVYIPSDNPTIIDRQPCCIIAYAYHDHVTSTSKNQVNCSICHISQDTLVRILPPRLATDSIPINRHGLESRSRLTASAFSSLQFRRDSMLSNLIGEEGGSRTTDEMIEELLQNYNEETIQELSTKISAAITSIRIGTTHDAFRSQEKQGKHMRKIGQSIQSFFRANSPQDSGLMREKNDNTDLQSSPSVIVHSPNHADGKTLLVHALAKRLGCSSIHLIGPGALLAKYSIRADSALESQLHAILVSAACRKEAVCIVLDQLDMILPARLSGRSNSGDSAIPIFNSIASYLRKLTDSIQRKREFPFPLKNPLYNPTGGDGSSGQILCVKFCLVGIVTCPDDGWRSNQQKYGESVDSGSSILDCMIGDRYRLPLLKANTVLSAFEAAFAREGIKLEESAKVRLALVASSAPWAKGGVFRRVAKQLKWDLGDDSMHSNNNSLERNEAKIHDLEKALALSNPDEVWSTKTEKDTENSPKGTKTHFGSIGGNESAKVSLEDALAFDPEKRKMLYKFGLSPPTGVLLYGPPGCGKTLLAKAVAKLFEGSVAGTAHSLSKGGTFISLSISEIVSAEVGTSEKTIASSFEFAEKNAPSVS